MSLPTKKLLTLLAVISATSAYADTLEHYTGSLTIDTTTLSTPFINASNNTIKVQGATSAVNGYQQLQQGLNILSFNTVMKQGGYMPYNINFSLNFGGMGFDLSSVGWTANGDTQGSSYTFSIVPPMYPVGQTPTAGDYCITVSVNGNAIHAPVCSIAIQKADSYSDDIWYIADGVVNVTVPGFLANSNVTITVNKVNGSTYRSQIMRCSRSTQWGTPSCQRVSTLSATNQQANMNATKSITSGASRLFN